MTDRYSTGAFRKSIVHYTLGRMINAAAAFFVFVWIARRLPETEYAYYVAAFALLELGLMFSSFGMDWVTAVFIPQMRVHTSGAKVNRFVWQCVGIQALSLSLGGALLFFAAPWCSSWFGLHGASIVLQTYAIVMVIEGLSRVFRDQLLACFLLQGAAQLSQMVRNLCLLLAAIYLFSHEQWRSAYGLAMAEIVASSGSLILAFIFLVRHLWHIRADAAVEPNWQSPSWRTMLHAGRNAWLSSLANMAWGGQMVVLIATRVIGVEATAALGFARNLSDQVRKYMPMEFLLGIVRTFVITRFSQEKDVHKLGIRLGLMYKANLLFLLPILALAITQGDRLCAFISHGRYVQAHYLLVGWLLLLVVWAHHRVTDLLAHALEQSQATRRVSLMLLFTPVLIVGAANWQSWLLLFALLCAAETAYSVLVLRTLRTEDWHYDPHWAGLLRMALATGLAMLGVLFLAWVLKNQSIPPALHLSLCASVSVLGVWLGAWLLGGFSNAELEMLPPRLGSWFKPRLA